MITLIIKPMYFIKACTWCNINLATDNGLNPLGFAGFIKIYTAMHYTVISNSDCSLPQLFDVLYKRLQTTGTVKNTVFSMNMKMCKIYHSLFSLSVICICSVLAEIMLIK